MELAEKKCDFKFVIKGNGLKRKCDLVKEKIETTEQNVLALETKKTKLL